MAENEEGQPQEDGANRRRHPRIKTSNVVTYVCIDDDGNEVGEGFGAALDLSLGGIKLATQEPVETPYVLLLAIDLEGDLLEVKGRVVYSQKADGKKYFAGIRFVDTEDKHHRIIRNFVKIYSHLMGKDQQAPGDGGTGSP
jgi:c-di-GMP-binding flagellar brake protein YcgR